MRNEQEFGTTESNSLDFLCPQTHTKLGINTALLFDSLHSVWQLSWAKKQAYPLLLEGIKKCLQWPTSATCKRAKKYPTVVSVLPVYFPAADFSSLCMVLFLLCDHLNVGARNAAFREATKGIQC